MGERTPRVLAAQILGATNDALRKRISDFKEGLKDKVMGSIDAVSRTKPSDFAMSTHITYRPQDLDARKLHGCLLGGIAPRSHCLCEHSGRQGRVNLAPFSYFNVFSANPPMVIFRPHVAVGTPRQSTPGTTFRVRKWWSTWWIARWCTPARSRAQITRKASMNLSRPA